MGAIRELMSDRNFDPSSHDSMFATILAKMDASERATAVSRSAIMEELLEIKTQCIKTNGRVNKLERWRETQQAKVAVAATLIAGLISALAWFLSQYVSLHS